MCTFALCGECSKHHAIRDGHAIMHACNNHANQKWSCNHACMQQSCKSEMVMQSCMHATIMQIRNGSKTVSESKQIANALNSHFVNVGPRLASRIEVQSGNDPLCHLHYRTEETVFQLKHVNEMKRSGFILTSIFSVELRVPLAVMLSVPILRSCGVLLCVVSTLSGKCVGSVKCMSHVMYCENIIKYSVFNDLSSSSSVCITR